MLVNWGDLLTGGKTRISTDIGSGHQWHRRTNSEEKGLLVEMVVGNKSEGRQRLSTAADN